jgi:antitoxin VapB
MSAQAKANPATPRAATERSASLNIKNPTTNQLIRRLADRTGESMTQAVTVAVQERLDRLEEESAAEREQRYRELQEVADRLAARFREPFKSLDHGEWLYDENGLPR